MFACVYAALEERKPGRLEVPCVILYVCDVGRDGNLETSKGLGQNLSDFWTFFDVDSS